MVGAVTFPEHALSIANHNTLGQLTNHSTFRISEGGALSKQELFSTLQTDWGERCCNNVKYVKNNVFFEQSSMKVKLHD